MPKQVIVEIPINKVSEERKLKMRDYYRKNRQNLLLQKRNIYQANRDIILSRNQKWRERNKELLLSLKKAEYLKNKEHYACYRKKYLKHKLETDSYFRFKHLMRTRLRIAIKKRYKTGSAIKDLGCSGEQAYNYIQSLFKDGMTWDNYGKWHIDHIKPLSSFNLEDREQFLKAVNYKNLQPLWALDNLKKKCQ